MNWWIAWTFLKRNLCKSILLNSNLFLKVRKQKRTDDGWIKRWWKRWGNDPTKTSFSLPHSTSKLSVWMRKEIFTGKSLLDSWIKRSTCRLAADWSKFSERRFLWEDYSEKTLEIQVLNKEAFQGKRVRLIIRIARPSSVNFAVVCNQPYFRSLAN